MASPRDSSLVDPTWVGSPRVPTLPRGWVIGLVRNAYECIGTLGSLVSTGGSVTEVVAGPLREVGGVVMVSNEVSCSSMTWSDLGVLGECGPTHKIKEGEDKEVEKRVGLTPKQVRQWCVDPEIHSHARRPTDVDVSATYMTCVDMETIRVDR